VISKHVISSAQKSELVGYGTGNNEFIHSTFLFEDQGILHNLGDRLRYIKKHRNQFAVNIQQRIDAILVRNSKLKPLPCLKEGSESQRRK